MTGIDYSPEMLDIARAAAEEEGHDVLWLCQDMREFELYGTVDAAVCCLDCINHLESEEELEKCFSLVHNYLIPDGIFIFDINGKYKFENIYGDETYVMESDDAYCVWQNYYNRKTHICDFYITLFKECEGGKYERFEDVQREKMYTLKYLKQALLRNSMEFIGAYSNFNFENASDEDERIYVVARCKKEDISKWQSR
jgi:SAM-dependent methyltransferase